MKKLKHVIGGLIFVLAILSPSLFKAQSGICTQTTCSGFLNPDNYQIYAAIRNQTISAITSGTVTISTNTTALGVTSSILTGSGTISAGALRLDFLTSSAFTGSINGVSWSPNVSVSFPSINYRTYPAMTYTVTTGSITLNDIR